MAVDHILEILEPLPGIQRDGTQFNSLSYIDGQWCRWYLGKPKKIGGYSLIDPGELEIIRNLYEVNKQNSVDIYLGRPSTVGFTNTNLSGIASPEVDRTPINFITDPNNIWTFDLYTNASAPTLILPFNPLATAMSSNTVTITVPDSSIFYNGQIVLINGAIGFDGLSASQLNVAAEITIASGTTLTYVVGGSAALTGIAGGGNNVTLSFEASINLANNALAAVNGSNIVTVTVADTSIFYNGQVINISGATTFEGLTVGQLNINAAITITSGITFTYVVGGSAATGTGSGGGANIELSYVNISTYLIAHAAPNASDINNNVQTNIYWGDINASTALTLIDPINLPLASSGVVVNYPYIFSYGNDGVVNYTTTPNDWVDAISVAIAGTKIIKGIITRGGSNSPSLLFFSMDAVIRATFTGGFPAFNFDTIQSNTSILSQYCVVTNFNIVFWIGVDQFYLYNGVVRPLENDMNKDYFFNNLNYAYRNKVFGWLNLRHNEIWWHWPKGNATECTDILIYNYKEERWYDSVLGRSAAYPPNFLSYPVLADSNAILNRFDPSINVTLPIPNNGIATVDLMSVVTVSLNVITNLQTGNLVTIAGATGFNGITGGQLNIQAPITVTSGPFVNTTFTYVSGGTANATGSGGGAAITYTQTLPNYCYGLWIHEFGNDMVLFNRTYAIQAYFETNLKSIFEKDPSQDRNLRARRIEPDFIQTGEMNLVINYRSFAQSTIYSSTPYIFLPGQEAVELAKIDTTQMGRLVSFRFESNTIGGFYQMGKVLLNYSLGDVRP